MSYRLPGREGARSSVVRGWVVRAVGGGCRAGAGLGCCEELVHDLGAGGDHRPQLAPVDDLGGAGGGVPGEPGDLLDAYAAMAQQADERGPQLPRRPAVPGPGPGPGLGLGADALEHLPDVASWGRPRVR